jgi:hypothetical protein
MNILIRSASQLVNPLARQRMMGYGTAAGGGVSYVGPLDSHTASLTLMLLPFRGLASYLGNAVRVRDTNDNSEQAVGFTAAGALASFTVVGNAAVRWWYDQSGSSNDLPQATAASQPYLTLNVVNSKPVLRFDGTDDTMQLAMSGAANRTVYMVCKFRATTGNARCWRDTVNVGANADIYYDAGTGKFYYYATTNVVDPVGGTATNWSVVCLKYTSGTTCAPYVNNTAATAFGTSSYQTGTKGFTLGSGVASSYGAVDIAARLVYDTAHSDGTRQAIQTILAAQFGITLA